MDKDIKKVGRSENKKIAFFDTPGIGGSLLNDAQLLNRIKEFDFVLFLTGGMINKTLDEEEIKFLQMMISERIPFSVIFNVSSEHFDDDSDLEKITKEIYYKILSIGGEPIYIFGSRVFLVKPYLYPNVKRLSDNSETLKLKWHTSNEKESGIPILREFLNISIGKRKCTLETFFYITKPLRNRI